MHFSLDCAHCVFSTGCILLGEEQTSRCPLPVMAVSLHALYTTSPIIERDKGDCREKGKVESILVKQTLNRK